MEHNPAHAQTCHDDIPDARQVDAATLFLLLSHSGKILNVHPASN